MTPAVQGLELNGYGNGTPQMISNEKLVGLENSFDPSF